MTAMEVLVLAAVAGSQLPLELIGSALQSLDTSIELLEYLPEPPLELQANQMILVRKHLEPTALMGILAMDRREPLRCSAEAPTSNDADTTALIKKIAKRDKKIKILNTKIEALTESLEEATQHSKHLEMEQEQFFEDVTEMKLQYDKLSENHHKIMWEYLASRDPDMRAIPLISKDIREDATWIGEYPLQEVLGYGQYAVVHASSTPEHSRLAIKVIDKEKLVDLVALHRINSEIASLLDPALRHPGILAMKDVIHTRKHIYLVTERGGQDLFEYFGSRDHGLDEEVIQPLMQRVMQALHVLHRHNYCHRDLKPENVLYSPEEGKDSFKLVKLVDFGLCTKAGPPHDHMLSDFCGSPGFFAPEVLLQERYDGMMADIWSLGCILLELVLGNSLFASIWMHMYEMEILKNHDAFRERVQSSLDATHEYCSSSKWTHSSDLRQVLLGMLCINPHDRMASHELVDHPWFSCSGPELVPHTREFSEPLPMGPPMARRSPSKKKMLSSISSPNVAVASATPFYCERTDGTGLLLNIAVRPLSAGEVTASMAAAVGSGSGSPRKVNAKMSLPSISPEKPPAAGGHRSPEKPASPLKRSGTTSHANDRLGS